MGGGVLVRGMWVAVITSMSIAWQASPRTRARKVAKKRRAGCQGVWSELGAL